MILEWLTNQKIS